MGSCHSRLSASAPLPTRRSSEANLGPPLQPPQRAPLFPEGEMGKPQTGRDQAPAMAIHSKGHLSATCDVLVFERYKLHCSVFHPNIHSPRSSTNPKDGVGETAGSPAFALHHPSRCAWGLLLVAMPDRDRVALEVSLGGTSVTGTHPSHCSAPNTGYQELPRMLTGQPAGDCCGGAPQAKVGTSPQMSWQEVLAVPRSSFRHTCVRLGSSDSTKVRTAVCSVTQQLAFGTVLI